VSPDSEPVLLGEVVPEILARLTPEAAGRYGDLKAEYRKLLEDERKAARQAERSLRGRKAKPEEFEQLRAKREEELRRLRDEFDAKVKALIQEAVRPQWGSLGGA
jgi:ElaB/YqjD/DUF883 family membrane-anchored ribosome-binding protein